MEAITKTQAVTLIDTWFLEQLEDKTKGLNAMHSIMETLEKKPVIAPSVTAVSKGTSKISPFRKDFKISGQVDSKTGLSYTSLRRQIENGVQKGYKEIDIIDAIIKAIPPTSGLRHYLEGKEKLTLSCCIQILRAHYNEKSATELYNELGQLTQNSRDSKLAHIMKDITRHSVLSPRKTHQSYSSASASSWLNGWTKSL